jgi:signal transduction histidine kinase
VPPRAARAARDARPRGWALVRHWLPWPTYRSPALVLAVSLLLTAAASAFVGYTGHQRDVARFENAVQAATDRIRTRLATYEALLYGTRGLFAASTEVSRDDFGEFVAELALAERFPGIQGIGFTRWLNPPGRDTAPAALGAALRANGSPARQLWPVGPRAEYHAIVFLEPLDRRNTAALGYDMSTEPRRHAAMARARDTGKPAASALVVLKQEIESQQQAGFLVYLPVYAGAGPPTTVDERRARLRGFVYAPFRAGDLLAGIFGSEEEPRVAFRLYDAPATPADSAGAGPGTRGLGGGPPRVQRARAGDTLAARDTAAARLLADSRRLPGVPAVRPRRSPIPLDAEWTRAEQLVAFGRRWTLVFTPTGGRDVGGGTRNAYALALLGTLLSLALARVTASEVRARQRAEKSDALRSRFFAAMSHELRTPINAVLGYNDLLLSGVYGPVADAQVAGIERSQRAARHLLELVNDVLDLSKLEAGKVEIEAETVRLDALLEDLLATIRPMAAERGCDLALEGSGCAATLRTDPRRLRQVLLNLLSNATKFGAGQPVAVRCRRLARGEHPEGRPVRAASALPPAALVVEVADGGPGIAAADQERIFEEFVQLPGGSAGGTGLGLPISRRLAELLGGALWVHSVPGHGATFSVVLPGDPPPDAADTPSRHAPP